ncbi:MAG TPA: AAA family ATPase [Gemmataceae bacterium]|nr:AAA family ATPase [Gemmataceae bacterium]
MRILLLILQRFGPFTDLTLDLAGGNLGFHVLYGRNEAGKSSALRALRQMLFGIDRSCVDDFLHNKDELRLGAILEHSDQSKLSFLRRKGVKNALRALDDKALVAEDELKRLLGGIEPQHFSTKFGLDHVRLQEGGQEILAGRGDIGQALFAAGLGIAGIPRVQKKLQEDLEDYFKPLGRNQRINKALLSLGHARTELKNTQLSAEEWLGHEQALATARLEHARLQEERDRLDRERQRLERIQRALPAVAELKTLLAELAAEPDARLLPEDFAARRTAAEQEYKLAEDRRDRNQAALTELTSRLQQLPAPDPLLHEERTVVDLHQRLGEYKKDLIDKPLRVGRRQQLLDDARVELRRLGREPDTDKAKEQVLTADEPVRIRNLGNRFEALVERQRLAADHIGDYQRRFDDLTAQLAALTATPDPAELRWTEQQITALGPLEARLAELQSQCQSAEEKTALAFKQLHPWAGTLAKLEDSAAPAVASIDRFTKQFQELANQRTLFGQRLQEIEKTLREQDQQLQELELQQEVPTESDVQRARQDRQATWENIRGGWLEPAEPVKQVRSQATELARTFEQQVQAADLLADRLRREAERVARKAHLLTGRTDSNSQLERLTKEETNRANRETHLLQSWADLWQPLDITPLPPAEMRQWLEQRTRILALAVDARARRDQAAKVVATIESQRARLSACLRNLGEPELASGESLADGLKRGRAVALRFETRAKNKQLLEKERDELKRQFETAQVEARRAEEDLKLWRGQWGQAVARLRLSPDAHPDTANAYLESEALLQKKLSEADDFLLRIRGIDRDTKVYCDDLQALLTRAAPDLIDQPVEDAAAALNSRLLKARQLQQERAHLEKRLQEEDNRRRAVVDSLGQAQTRLELLCAEAGCSTPAQLQAAETRSQRRRQRENAVTQQERLILAESAGQALQAFLAEVDGENHDARATRLQQLKTEHLATDHRLGELRETIGAEQKTLETLGSRAPSADAAERIESLIAVLRDDVEQYACLRLADVLLRRGLERYRERNRNPIVERASDLFAQLSAGSFAGLRPDFDEDGKEVLKGIRAGNTQALGVEAMSSGTQDQLYLAIRIASLEAWLAKHEPIPLVLDDLLLNFDDERARAALQVLASLSRKTQVLFFTHHAHLVELARAAVPAEQLFVHELPGRVSA